MFKFEEEFIKEVNRECPYDQGIFTEPWGIPIRIKEQVIYGRYKTGGVSGGSCWGGENYRYYEDAPNDRMRVLDIILKKIFPNITFLQFREIEKLIHADDNFEDEYYGNSTDYKVEYILVSEFLELIESWKNN